MVMEKDATIKDLKQKNALLEREVERRGRLNDTLMEGQQIQNTILEKITGWLLYCFGREISCRQSDRRILHGIFPEGNGREKC
jgi:hypothetical protein